MSEPVLVVGAGPTGLTMAAELARHGTPCRIIDQDASASTTSKALAIHSRTLELFDDIGIVEEATAAGVVVRAGNIYAGGRRIFQLDLGEIESPYACALDLAQSETERILANHLAQRGVQVERQVALRGFYQDEAGATATLRHADGRDETFSTPWLIGCDGPHSTVRHTLGLPFEGSPYPEAFALADVKLAGPVAPDEWHIFLHRDGLLAVFPLPGGRARIIAETAPPAEGAPVDPTLEAMQAIVAERGPEGATMSDPVWLAAFRIHRRCVPRLRQGRVFLAGDAAHIHSPAGGQGMNTGIQDAYNLAWKLALVATGRAPVSLLESYQAERHPVAEGLLRMTDLMTRAATLRIPVAEEVRNHLYAFLGQQEVIQQRLATRIAELSIHYRGSPVVAEHVGGGLLQRLSRGIFAGGPRAGDRAPDAGPLARHDGSPAQLFDILRGTAHVLLLFGGTETAWAESGTAWGRLGEIAAAAQGRYGDRIRAYRVPPAGVVPGAAAAADVLLDPDQALHSRYGAGAACLFLIRPDGYVGFRSEPPDWNAFEEYLEGVLLPAGGG